MAWACSSDAVRTSTYATGNGPQSGIDSGQLLSRVLTVTKAEPDTDLRISYTDNFRVLGGVAGSAARWELRIDGASCPSQALAYDIYSSQDSNHHRSDTFVGYCRGLGAGTYEVQVWVGAVPGFPASGDAYTGWLDSTWVLEAEEVF